MNNFISLVHISDTHNDYDFNVGSGDVLIHSGDATQDGTKKELSLLRDFFLANHKNFKHIIFTPGNHDKCMETSFNQCKTMLSVIPNLTILMNQTITLCGIKFFGSPFSTKYMNWSFMDTSINLAKIWNTIEVGTDVVITHGPPFGVLDYVPRGVNIGCNTLRWTLSQINPKVHLFGHIHENWGLHEKEGIWFVNGAMGANLNGEFIQKYPRKIIFDATTKEVLEISDID